MSSARVSLVFRDYVAAALLLAWPLALLAEGLVRRTHHRPLGAATFASLSVVAFLLTAFLPARLRVASAGSGRAVERVVWAFALLSLLAAVVRGFAT